MNVTQESFDLRYNYYSLALSLVKNISVDQSLIRLGLAAKYKTKDGDADDLRQIVEMKQKGMKLREIGEAMGLTTSAVSHRLARCGR
jgi:hypothetical protein